MTWNASALSQPHRESATRTSTTFPSRQVRIPDPSSKTLGKDGPRSAARSPRGPVPGLALEVWATSHHASHVPLSGDGTVPRPEPGHEADVEVPLLALLGICVQIPVSLHLVLHLVPVANVEIVDDAGDSLAEDLARDAGGDSQRPDYTLRDWDGDSQLPEARPRAGAKACGAPSGLLGGRAVAQPSVGVESLGLGVQDGVSFEELQGEAQACLCNPGQHA